jgi:FtsP/CotA-like multicopper oxidase with cupredoxin domain
MLDVWRSARRALGCVVLAAMATQTVSASQGGPNQGESFTAASPGTKLHDAVRGDRTGAAASGMLFSENFTGVATTPSAWSVFGPVCLTAGTSTTPATSVPACKTKAPQDPAGQGALQLTSNAVSLNAMLVTKSSFPTANGLQVTFTDYAFNSASSGGDGMTFFFTDASQPAPAAFGVGGAALGYANRTLSTSEPAAPGIANAYVGVGLDEDGNFSNPASNLTGGPGKISETVAARGASATGWQYLGGVTKASGAATSLPFHLDQPTATTRPSNAPTIQATLLANGLLTVAIDIHDGNGFVTYYSQSIVGVNGQPAVPANVYFGFSASSGSTTNRHQVTGLIISANGTPTPTPIPTATPTSTPTPNTTPTPTLSPTPTPTPTPTPSPSLTPTPTATPTPSPTATPTPPPTATPTPSPTATPTPSPTATPTPPPTATPTPSSTPTPSPTPTSSPTATASPTPSPTATPVGFSPLQIPNLTAWYDPSVASNISTFGSSVAAINDESGNGNTLAQATSAREPTYTASGIDGLGSLVFNGKTFLISANGALSTSLFNESTTFIVASPASQSNTRSLYSGAYNATPRWEMLLGSSGATYLDFNNASQGRISTTIVNSIPALWTLAGSVSNNVEILRKDGNLLATNTGPGAAVTGNYPLALGAMAQGTSYSSEFTGEVGEVVTFGRYLTASESAEMEGYLACKWGLQTRLPTNHPYRHVCPQGTANSQLPVPSPSPGALSNPPEIESSNGALTFNVAVQADPVTGNPEFNYNGSTTPPTLRLLPGDTLYVNLTNNLPVPPAGALYANSVNLHYHGLHVSPLAPSDDSIDMLAAPGQSLNYVIAIPSNHPPGLYWYHSHAHGETERQTLSGMSGALIIDGIAQYSPQVANLPEQVLIVRDAPLAGQALPAANKSSLAAMRWAMRHAVSMRGLPTHGTPMLHKSELRSSTNARTRNPYVLIDPHYRRFVRPTVADTHCIASSPEAPVKALTLNGLTQPSIAIRKGEQQFWRMVNASADTYVDVAVDSATLNIVAIDGVPLSSGVNTPASMSVAQWLLPPASRVDFTITGPNTSTVAYLRTLCFDTGPSGQPMPAQILASLNPASSPSDQAKRRIQRIAKRAKLYHFRSAASIRAAAVSQTRTLYYGDQNTINGIAYSPGAPPMFYTQSGTVEEWTIVNNSTQVHTFHIHQVHFVVEAINGTTQSKQYVMDNVNVPAATTSGPGSVKVLLDFTDPTIIGTFLLHCHILSHEDAGMMAAIRVGTAPPLNVSTSSLTFVSPQAAAQTVTISGGAPGYGVGGCNGIASASVSGASLTVTPISSGSCVLTVSDSSNPSIISNITVTVDAPSPVLAVAPNVASFTSATANPQSVTITGGTQPYSLSGCTGIALGTVTGQTVQLAPQAAGACSFVITDANGNQAVLSVSVNPPLGGSALDNLTFHNNAMRQGWNQNESVLTTANVASPAFGQVATLTAPAGMPAFGKVYAQPLYATNEADASGNLHNLVVIATSTDQLYAFDDVTLQVVWHTDFTGGGANNVRQQLWTDVGCSDVSPDMGIIGTPVIDRTIDRLYVVVTTMEHGTPYMRLHAVSLSTGVDVVAPMPITGTETLATGGIASVSPLGNMNRAALLEANGNIYVALAAHCDSNLGSTFIHGWVLAYNAANLQETGSIVDLTNGSDGTGLFLGSPWMAGYGPAADAAGNIYFVTGNGPYNGSTDFSMSAMKLPGNLNIGAASWFTPASEAADSAADQDFGSAGVMLLPDQPGPVPHVAVTGGKCSLNGVGCLKYLLNRDNMGGMQAGNVGAIWQGNTANGIWGGPAYFVDAAGTQHVLYGGFNYFADYAIGYPLSLIKQSSVPIRLVGTWQGSQPVVSSNGVQAGTAIAWALQTPGTSGGKMSLIAFDALTMSILFSGVAGTWIEPPHASTVGEAMVSSLVANGRVYVPTDGSVAVFGLTTYGNVLPRHRSL